MAEKKKKHHFSHTHMEHHDDGSVTVHHMHESGDSKKDAKHAVADLDGAHDSMEEHLGTPNVGESAADAGQHGVAEPAASAAGLPASGMAGGAPGGM